MLASLSIRTRLISAFSLLFIMLISVACAGYWGMSTLVWNMNDIASVDANLVEYAQRSRANINMLRRFEKDLFMNLDNSAKTSEYLQKWDDALKRSHERLDAMAKLVETPKDKETLAAIRKQIDSYEGGFRTIVKEIKDGGVTSTQQANEAMARYKEASSTSEAMVTEFAKQMDSRMEAMVKDAAAAAAQVKSVIIGMTIVAALLSLVLAITIIRSITRPLYLFLERTTDIAQGEGDLTKRLEAEGNDEIAQVSRMFNLFIEKLRTIISQVAHTSGQVAAASDQLRSTAVQIATGAEEVAAQTGTVATASEEMSATSSDIARNCHAVAEASNQANDAANESAYVVMESVNIMNAIADQVRESAQTVSGLGQRSDQIGEIVSTIEDIADQTNLLALNAAIEAARAGEQGRGFAVVADEVRALAERTTRATREISEMIKSIQTETAKAVALMDNGVAEVEHGVTESAKSSEALVNVLTQISEVSSQVGQIATAAEEQTATTNEITRNVHEITEVVSTTAQGASETASAATELSRHSEELQRLVNQFKL